MTTEEALAALGRYASDEDRERAEAYVRGMADVVAAARVANEAVTTLAAVDALHGVDVALRALDGGER